MRPRLPSLLLLLPLVGSTLTTKARADPWLGAGDNHLEDLLIDGDLDVEDLVHATHVARSRGGAQDLRAGSWVSIGSFFRVVDGKEDLGVLLVVSAPFDRAAQGPVHNLSVATLPYELREGALVASSVADGPAKPPLIPPAPPLPTASSPPSPPPPTPCS